MKRRSKNSKLIKSFCTMLVIVGLLALHPLGGGTLVGGGGASVDRANDKAAPEAMQESGTGNPDSNMGSSGTGAPDDIAGTDPANSESLDLAGGGVANPDEGGTAIVGGDEGSGPAIEEGGDEGPGAAIEESGDEGSGAAIEESGDEGPGAAIEESKDGNLSMYSNAGRDGADSRDGADEVIYTDANINVDKNEAKTEPETAEVADGKAVNGLNAGLRMGIPARDGSYDYADTIDLSYTKGKTGTGFNFSEGNASYADYNSTYGRYLGESFVPNLSRLNFAEGANGKAYHIKQSASYQGSTYGTSTVRDITIASNTAVTLAVTRIDIVGAIELKGNANLNLVLDSNSTIRSSIIVPPTATLTVNTMNGDSDSLTIKPTEGKYSGTGLNARIGGLGGNSGGSITINGGTLHLFTFPNNDSLSAGAGIGGGGANGGNAGNGGNITINGGNINITATTTGAGVGGGGATGGYGGNAGNGGNIKITGGRITITQNGQGTTGNSISSGAGIGGGGGIDGGGNSGNSGNGGNAGDLLISGGTISVSQYTRAAAIGAGTFGGVGNITISDGTVNAEVVSPGSGAAIGSNGGAGGVGGDGKITISGGTVNAVSTFTGIGKVYGPCACDINITGGSVYAKGEQGPGIGYWSDPVGGDAISFSGGRTIAESDSSAGIGGKLGKEPDFYLDPSADVKAYSKGDVPAINVKNITGVAGYDGYYANASFASAPSSSTDTEMYVYRQKLGVTLLKTLSLPAGYRHFGYSSELNTSRTDYVFANRSHGVNAVVCNSDGKEDICSIDNYNGYSSHNGTNGALPVKLDNPSQSTYCRVVEKHVEIDGSVIVGIDDYTTMVPEGGNYSKTIPGIPNYIVRGYKWDNPPTGAGTFEFNNSVTKTMTENETIYFIYAKSPKITRLEHSEVEKTTAKLETEFALNGMIFVGGKFEISDDNGATWKTANVGSSFNGSAGTGFVRLERLTPNTRYKYRVTVTYTANDELASDVKEFVTKPSISGGLTGPGADPSKVAVSAQFKGGQETLKEVRVYYSTNEIDENNPASWTVDLPANAFTYKGFTNFNVGNLIPDTAYNFLVVIKNEAGTDKYKMRYEGQTDVTVTKTVTGDNGDKTKEFQFVATLMDGDGKPVESGRSFDLEGSAIVGSDAKKPDDVRLETDNDGKLYFNLMHGQGYTIKGLLVGSQIKVEENDYTGYVASYKDNEAGDAIPARGTGIKPLTSMNRRIFDFENERHDVVVSGIGGADWISMALLFCLAFVLVKFMSDLDLMRKRRQVNCMSQPCGQPCLDGGCTHHSEWHDLQ